MLTAPGYETGLGDGGCLLAVVRAGLCGEELVGRYLNRFVLLPATRVCRWCEVDQHEVYSISLRLQDKRQIVIRSVASKDNTERFVNGVGTASQSTDRVKHLRDAFDDLTASTRPCVLLCLDIEARQRIKVVRLEAARQPPCQRGEPSVE